MTDNPRLTQRRGPTESLAQRDSKQSAWPSSARALPPPRLGVRLRRKPLVRSCPHRQTRDAQRRGAFERRGPLVLEPPGAVAAAGRRKHTLAGYAPNGPSVFRATLFSELLERLTPGFEHRRARPALAATYMAVAAGMGLGALATSAPLGFLTPRTGNGQPPSKRQPFPPPAAMVKDVLELLPQGMRALGSRCFRQPMQIGRGARS